MVRYSRAARDGTEYVLREPMPTDARNFLRFINPIIDEPMSGIMMTDKVKLKSEQTWLRGRLQDIRSRRLVFLVVEVDGRVCGSCHVSKQIGKQSHMSMLGIALSRDMRGKGIGEDLMRTSISLAQRRLKGIEMVMLATFSYNKRAQALYRKVGFAPVCRLRNTVKEGNRYFDELFMILDLKKFHTRG